ncbi:hypothetical protein C8J56DRAFT_1043255 [Mycena floridula]|nr:hypothetical protein C8J56DRAFT_1043255 [Mycena floridula]
MDVPAHMDVAVVANLLLAVSLHHGRHIPSMNLHHRSSSITIPSLTLGFSFTSTVHYPFAQVHSVPFHRPCIIPLYDLSVFHHSATISRPFHALDARVYHESLPISFADIQPISFNNIIPGKPYYPSFH